MTICIASALRAEWIIFCTRRRITSSHTPTLGRALWEGLIMYSKVFSNGNATCWSLFYAAPVHLRFSCVLVQQATSVSNGTCTTARRKIEEDTTLEHFWLVNAIKVSDSQLKGNKPGSSLKGAKPETHGSSSLSRTTHLAHMALLVDPKLR